MPKNSEKLEISKAVSTHWLEGEKKIMFLYSEIVSSMAKTIHRSKYFCLLWKCKSSILLSLKKHIQNSMFRMTMFPKKDKDAYLYCTGTLEVYWLSNWQSKERCLLAELLLNFKIWLFIYTNCWYNKYFYVWKKNMKYFIFYHKLNAHAIFFPLPCGLSGCLLLPSYHNKISYPGHAAIVSYID